MDIVVSYYNNTQFIDLLNAFTLPFRTIVYNKSGTPIHFPNKKVIVYPRMNVGREGETYLNHIIQHYDSLPEYTLFIQDDTREHLPKYDHFIEFCKKSIQQRTPFIMYPCTWRENGHVIKRTIHQGCCTLHTLPSVDAIYQACNLLGIIVPEMYVTETCAFFLCHQSVIRRHPKEFYVKLRDWLLLDDRHGFVLEHLWKLIFISVY
jgi:hypothetical protein